MLWSTVGLLAAFVVAVGGRATPSFPHVYPGMPSGDYSPEWQNCESHPSLP